MTEETPKPTDSFESENNQEIRDDLAKVEQIEETVETEEKPQEIEKPAVVEGKKNRTQKRIDSLVRERGEARRRVEELESKLEADNEAKDKPTASPEDPEVEDFENFDDYLTALDKFYEDNPEVEKPKEEPKVEKNQESTLTPDQLTAVEQIKESVDSEENLPEDFDDVAYSESVSISVDMLEAIALADSPAQLMYYLGSNLEESKSIANSTPKQQARTIAKLESKISSFKKKPVKTTSASEPITPVGKRDSSLKAPAEMDFSEYAAYRDNNETSKNGW